MLTGFLFSGLFGQVVSALNWNKLFATTLFTLVVEFLEPLSNVLRDRTSLTYKMRRRRRRRRAKNLPLADRVFEFIGRKRRIRQKDLVAHVSSFRVGLLLGVFTDAFKVGS